MVATAVLRWRWVFVIGNGGGYRRSRRRQVFVVDGGGEDHINIDLGDDIY
jgi:hypothetical protein